MERGDGPYKVSYFCKETGELVHVDHYGQANYYEEVESDAQSYSYGYTYKIEKYQE